MMMIMMMIMIIIIMMIMMMIIIIIMMIPGERDNGLGNDGYPRGQGERPEEANTQKKSRMIFFLKL